MSACNYDLVLIKGAPGVGKSTAAKLLAKRLPAGVVVEVDTLRRMVVNVNWKDQAEHRVVLDIAARVGVHFLRAGFKPCVIVDTFSGDKVHGFLASLLSEFPHAQVFVAVLHASNAVLQERVVRREADGFRDVPICRRINEEVVRDAGSFETLIDTSTLSPEEATEAIARALRSPSSASTLE